MNDVSFSGCDICTRIEAEMYRFLCHYQYDVFCNSEVQASLAEHGGLCRFHTWRYQSIASKEGTCAGFEGVLKQLAKRLRDRTAVSPVEALPQKSATENCDLCQVENEIERTIVAKTVQKITENPVQALKDFCGVCLPHFQQMAELISDQDILRELIIREADLIESLSEDMRRYTMRDDNDRRLFTSETETSAAQRALVLLAGYRNLIDFRRGIA